LDNPISFSKGRVGYRVAYEKGLTEFQESERERLYTEKRIPYGGCEHLEIMVYRHKSGQIYDGAIAFKKS
jgi:hypothetical protein